MSRVRGGCAGSNHMVGRPDRTPQNRPTPCRTGRMRFGLRWRVPYRKEDPRSTRPVLRTWIDVGPPHPRIVREDAGVVGAKLTTLNLGVGYHVAVLGTERFHPAMPVSAARPGNGFVSIPSNGVWVTSQREPEPDPRRRSAGAVQLRPVMSARSRTAAVTLSSRYDAHQMPLRPRHAVAITPNLFSRVVRSVAIRIESSSAASSVLQVAIR